MSSQQALKMLTRAGWRVSRNAKGDHILLKREDKTMIIPGGKSQLSHGMVGKVRSYSRQGRKNEKKELY